MLHSPPTYEAEVFIGFDAKANDFIAHWLDRFGAAGARVVARGERNGQQLVIVFPYTEAHFVTPFRGNPLLDAGRFFWNLSHRMARGQRLQLTC